jgi:uncharacterized membrane protein YfbV (UPF0208 family)
MRQFAILTFCVSALLIILYFAIIFYITNEYLKGGIFFAIFAICILPTTWAWATTYKKMRNIERYGLVWWKEFEQGLADVTQEIAANAIKETKIDLRDEAKKKTQELNRQLRARKV